MYAIEWFIVTKVTFKDLKRSSETYVVQ